MNSQMLGPSWVLTASGVAVKTTALLEVLEGAMFWTGTIFMIGTGLVIDTRSRTGMTTFARA